jgi:hypothetical protein
LLTASEVDIMPQPERQAFKPSHFPRITGGLHVSGGWGNFLFKVTGGKMEFARSPGFLSVAQANLSFCWANSPVEAPNAKNRNSP